MSRGGVKEPTAPVADAPQPAAEATNGTVPHARKALSKADIMGSRTALPTEEVPTPEWAEGGFVTVRAMDGRARLAYEAAINAYRTCAREAATGKDLTGKTIGSGDEALKRLPGLFGVVAANGIIDPATGTLMFTVEEVRALEQLHAAPLQRCYDVILRISEATEAAHEAAVKN